MSRRRAMFAWRRKRKFNPPPAVDSPKARGLPFAFKEPLRRPPMETPMKKLNLIMLAASAILISYYVWNFFVGSRYQALCSIDYWHATQAQLDACKEVKSEFDDRK
jgi:hypothetical protein